MASRRKAREYALQALYTADIAENAPQSALNDLWSGLLDGEGMDPLRPPESQEVEFAQRLVSTPGEHDGLFWPTAAGEEPSPLAWVAMLGLAMGIWRRRRR